MTLTVAPFDIDGYLLTGTTKKNIVKVQPFSSVETVHMQDYIKLTKPNFDPSLYILNIGSNNLSLQETPEAISKRIIATVKNHRNIK